MLLKSCPRCKKLIPYGKTYCDACAPVVEEQIRERKRQWNKTHMKKYNATRDPKYKRFYGSSEWIRLSQTAMQESKYTCKDCGVRAGQIVDEVPIKLEVHHTIPIQTVDGWRLRYSYDNLEVLCTRCHNARHGRFKKKDKGA